MNETDIGFAFVGTNQAIRMKNYIFAFVCVHIQTYSLYVFTYYTYTLIYMCTYTHENIFTL